MNKLHSARSTVSRRRLLKTTGAIGAATVLGTSGRSLFAASENIGGTLNYLSFEGYDDAEAMQPLAEKYGVVLNSTYIDNNPEILTKYIAGGPGRYDVGLQYDRFFPPMFEHDMLEPLNLDLIPNFEQIYPRFQNANWVQHEGKIYGIPGFFGFLDAVNYRADKIIPAPESYAVLIDPKYKGTVGVRSDATDNLLLIGALIYDFGVDGTKYTKDQLKQCLDWAQKLRDNAKTRVHGYGELADLLIRGDIWLGTVGWEFISLQGQQAGVDVRHMTSKSGPTPAWTDSFFIFKGSQNVETAHAWINQMLSAESMALLAQKLGTFIANPNAVPLLPESIADGMGFAQVNDQLDRAVVGTLPAPEQSDPNLATLDDFNSGWEAIWA